MTETTEKPPVSPGETFAGKYLVERVLGAGAMGIVVAARHLALDQKVAIKFLRIEAAKDEEIVERFAREGRAAAKIESDHVARVMDVGTTAGTAYLVMEYLDGADLASVLRERGSLPAGEAVRFIREAADAVSDAHEAGIVHRDLKPANLFLAKKKNGKSMVKVLDFGISKVVAPAGAPDFAQTKTHAVFGSPLYMSPEQVKSSRDVDGRSDVWSLGVILYELLAGKAPFHGETLAGLVNDIMNGTPVPIVELRPDVPEPLADILMRALAKSRDDRWPTAAAFRDALEPFQRATSLPPETSAVSSQASTGPIPASKSAAVPPELQTGSRAWGGTRSPQSAPPSRAWIRFALGGAALAVAIGVTAIYTHSAKVAPPEVPAQPPPSAPPSVTVAIPSPPPAESIVQTPSAHPAPAQLASTKVRPAPPPSSSSSAAAPANLGIRAFPPRY